MTNSRAVSTSPASKRASLRSSDRAEVRRRRLARACAAITAGAAGTGAFSAGARSAQATTYYWDTTTTGTWNTGASWSDTATTGGTTGVVPTSGDSAVFNQSSVSGNETVQLAGNQSITGMTFNNTGTTLIDASTATSWTLTNGTGGITIASTAGAVTLGNSTNIVNVALSGNQSWTNNSTANTFTDVNGITNTGNTTAFALTLGGAGNFALQGVISNGGTVGTVGLTQGGTGTTTLSGANSYTGATTVNSGTLALTNYFTSTTSPLVMGGGTLNLSMSAAGNQTFGSTTFNAGLNVISAASISGTPTLALNAITDNVGGTVEFVGPATIGAGNASVASTAAITTATPGNVGGSLKGLWTGPGSSAVATVGLYDWATTDTAAGGNGTSPFTFIGGSQVTGFYTTLNGTMAAGGINYDVTGNSSSFSTPSLVTLRFNTNAAITFTTPNVSWPLGGILVTPNVGAHNVNFTNNTSGQSNTVNQVANDNLSIFQNNTSGELIFNATNYYGFAGSGAYIQSGPGTVWLKGLAGGNYTGQTYLNGGVTLIDIQSSGGAGGTAGQLGGNQTSNVNLNGGSLIANYTGNLDGNGSALTAHPIILGNNGGGLGATTGNTLTVDGVISGAAGTGPLVIGIPASSANGNTSGLVPGTGNTTVAPGLSGNTANAAVFGNGTIILTNNNTYSGSTTISAGTLRVNNTSGSGTGTGSVTVAATTTAGNSGNYTGGTLGGSGNISGTVTLSGNNTAKHGGIITAGTSAAPATLTTGNQTWNQGAAYQWHISNSGNVAVGSGLSANATNDILQIGTTSSATLNVSGNSTDPFTIAPLGNLTSSIALGASNTYNWELAQIGTGNATQISINGNTTSASSTNLMISTSAFALDTSGLSVGSSNSQFLSASNFSLYFQTISGNNELVLSYNAAPEPGSTLLILCGVVPAMSPRRRRRRQQSSAK